MAKFEVVALANVVLPVNALMPLNVLLLESKVEEAAVPVNAARQVPLMEMQPALRLMPFAAVVVAPLMVSTEPLFPIVVLPFLSIAKTVVVAKAEVEEEMARRGAVLPAKTRYRELSIRRRRADTGLC